MGKFHDQQFPGESSSYRQARDNLLQEELELRKRITQLADKRRKLPMGGKLKEDYVFDEIQQSTETQTPFSQLFSNNKHTLFVYSFMYGPDWDNPCPMCTAILDSLNGNAIHILDRIDMVVVAKAPIQKSTAWAKQRGWDNLRLLSSMNNSYNKDYFGETSEAAQIPAINVFKKNKSGIFHFYNTELLYVPPEKGQDMRHADLIWPLWNVFDMTPDGRGTDWYPKPVYD